MTIEDLCSTLEVLYGRDNWPKPLNLLLGWHKVNSGLLVPEAAKGVGTTKKRLQEIASSEDPLIEILGTAIPTQSKETKQWAKAGAILGQLLLGHVAELVFARMFKAEMPNQELSLKDVREGRTDTDYRLLNDGKRPVYRLNIKFHGSRFRRAAELVGLDPEDSFALATYKIHGALKKQEEEQLPYFFAIVGVSNLSGQVVGDMMPQELREVMAYLTAAPKMANKRDLEDRIVEYVASKQLSPFEEILSKLQSADWYIMSARRADKLLREKLFDRVFALRIRNFARVFGGAEIDMHFSLSQDLIPISDFFKTVREGGLHKVTTLLERGDF